MMLVERKMIPMIFICGKEIKQMMAIARMEPWKVLEKGCVT